MEVRILDCMLLRNIVLCMLQFFMELMKVPRVESKLRVFSFKITFSSQVKRFVLIFDVIELECCCNFYRPMLKDLCYFR